MAMTRCHLSTATGGIFFPAVEVGPIVIHPDTWALVAPPGMEEAARWDGTPFRVDSNKRSAGDFTLGDCPVHGTSTYSTRVWGGTIRRISRSASNLCGQGLGRSKSECQTNSMKL